MAKLSIAMIRANLFSGPGNWITDEMLCNAKRLGFPVELKSLPCLSHAAIFRVWQQCGLQICLNLILYATTLGKARSPKIKQEGNADCTYNYNWLYKYLKEIALKRSADIPVTLDTWTIFPFVFKR